MAERAREGYAASLEACSRMAQEEVGALLDRLDLDDPVTCKRVLLIAYPAIIAKYGGMAAAAAAECYAGDRNAVLGGEYTPLLAEPVDAGAVRAKVRYALRYLFGEVDDGDGGGQD